MLRVFVACAAVVCAVALSMWGVVYGVSKNRADDERELEDEAQVEAIKKMRKEE